MNCSNENTLFSSEVEGDLLRLPSVVGLKETCSDFLLDILKNPPGGDSRLDMEDTIDDFQL